MCQERMARMQSKQPTAGPGVLYVVATPIGNLRDITLRALDVLTAADVIAAEDTRTTGNLLKHYSLFKQMFALHQHNERATVVKVAELLRFGKSVALVCDAGTPAISDPGAIIIKTIREHGYKIIPIPGANAAVCALSAAGVSTPHFLFYGFLPSKTLARCRELENLKPCLYNLVFYEAPHRILECVEDLYSVLGESREITIARELTKVFETIHTCQLGNASAWLQGGPDRQKGEFVLIVTGAEGQKRSELSDEAQRILKLLLSELPLKPAVKLAAEISGESKNLLYSAALLLQSQRKT
jgi:16S rRNA (cytidine1402-2'-O)-methyltransferase